MKAIILKEVAEKLISLPEAELYGYVLGDTVFISSLEQKEENYLVGGYDNDNSGCEYRFVLLHNNGKFEALYDDGSEVEYIHATVVNYMTDFSSRNHGIIDPSVLQQRTVTIIGAGSGGSFIALALARSGVTNFKIIDFDIVDTANICRASYDVTDIGDYKVDALKEKLLCINPFIKIEAIKENILQMDKAKLEDLIQNSDLIIEATDNVKTKQLINGLAYARVPMLFPAVYDQGKGGDVLKVIPGGPCYDCVFSSIFPEMKEAKKTEWDYTTGSTKPMSGLIADIHVVCARTVKLALAILTGDQDNSFLHKVTEENCSLLMISNESNCHILDKPFIEIWAETKIDEDCACRSLPCAA